MYVFDVLLIVGVAALLSFIVARNIREKPASISRIEKSLKFRMIFVVVYVSTTTVLFLVGIPFIEPPDLVPYLFSAVIIGVSLGLSHTIVDWLKERGQSR